MTPARPAATDQAVSPLPQGLPAPTRDPLAIDPATDPILALARRQAAPAEFRATIAAAIARSPTFDEVRAGEVEAAAVRDEAKARGLPVVDLGFSSFKVIDRQFSNDPQNLLERQRPNHRTDATARIQQALVDFGATGARIAAGKARIEVAAAATEDASTQLALQVIAQWYNVYGFRALVHLGEAFAASQRELRDRVGERVRQGYAAPADIAQVDGYIASADSQLAEFRRALANAEAQFGAITGTPPPPGLGRAPTPDLSIITRDSVAGSVDRLAVVRGARAAAAASHQDAKALKADLFPQLTMGIDGGRYGVFETANDYDIRGNVTLSWRFGGGGVQRLAQADARAAGADARARRTREDAARDAEIAWSDVAALEQARAAMESSYIASRRSRDVLVERFRVARGTLFDVAAAESNFFSVAARYIQTVTDLDTARYVLLARTGRLLPTLEIDPVELRRR